MCPALLALTYYLLNIQYHFLLFLLGKLQLTFKTLYGALFYESLP